MHYLTVMSPVRRHMKLFSYYSIIWRNSTSSSDSDTSSSDSDTSSSEDADSDTTSSQDDPDDRTILTTTFYLIVNRTILTIGRSWRQDDPDDKILPYCHRTIRTRFPRDSTRFHLNRLRTTLIKFHLNTLLPISQITPPTSSSTTIILNKPEDWEQWLWQLRALVD